MTIVVACPGCRAKLSADDRMIGRTTACPKCGANVPIEPPATPPPSSHGTGPGSALLIGIVVAVAAFGVLFVLGAVALGMLFYLGRSTTVIVPTATQVPAVAPPSMVAVPPLQVAPPVAGIPLGPGVPLAAPVEVAVDNSAWLPLPENPHRLSAKFPTEPAAFDPLEASFAGEGEEADLAREFAAEVLKSAETVAYRAQDGEKTYSLSAMAFDLTSVPTEEYLDRLGSMIELTQPGFTKRKEARLTLNAPPELSLPQETFPAYQAWLESDDAKRIVRVVPVGKVMATLQVEGPKTMSDDDLVAKAFLDSFGLMDRAFAVGSFELSDAEEESPAGPANPPTSGVDGLRSLPVRPASQAWQEFSGAEIDFRVSLPAEEIDRPSVEAALVIAGEDVTNGVAYLREAQKNFAKTELLVAEQGDRRFIVVAAKIDPAGLEWYDVMAKVGAAIDPWTGVLYPPPHASNHDLTADEARESAAQGTSRTEIEVRDLPDGRSALYQKRIVGQYGFLLLYESASPVAADDPDVRRFFDSLVDQADAKLP